MFGACLFVCSRVCSSQTGIIRKYHIFMCRQCFRDQAELIGFRKVRLAVARPLGRLRSTHAVHIAGGLDIPPPTNPPPF